MVLKFSTRLQRCSNVFYLFIIYNYQMQQQDEFEEFEKIRFQSSDEDEDNDDDISHYEKFLDVITNKQFNLARSEGRLENLYQYYTGYPNVNKYLSLVFPLFQNEHHHSIVKDGQKFKSLIENEIQFPLPFTLRLKWRNKRYLIFDAVEQEEFPTIETHSQKEWRYQHFKDYLLFSLSMKYFVCVYIYLRDKSITSSHIGFLVKKLEKRKDTNKQGKKKLKYTLYLKNTEKLQQVLSYQNIQLFRLDLDKLQYSVLQNHEGRKRKDDLWEEKFDVFIYPVSNTSTYENEEQALFDFRYIKNSELFLGQIDKGKYNSQPLPKDISIALDIMKQNKILNRHFNMFQFDAISDSLNFNKKLTLISGPPGTGKTQTTLGIISCLTKIEFKPNDVFLLLGRSNTVVNGLVKRIKESILAEASIINFTKAKEIPLQVMRVGRPEKSEPEIFEDCLEIKVQDQVFKENRKLFEKNFFDIIENVKEMFQFVGLVTLITFIELENKKTTSKEYLNRLGSCYIKMVEFFKSFREQQNDLEEQYLSKTNILVSTVNSCSNFTAKQFLAKKNIKMCIIDEAPTALEPTMLIPITTYNNIEKFVFLGDLEQLNPIYNADDTRDFSYHRSLYERLSKVITVQKLRIQYRQYHNLHMLTSEFFYNNEIVNGLFSPEFPCYLQNKLNPNNNLLFFDSLDSKEENVETSFCNLIEITAIISMVKYLLDGSTMYRGNLICSNQYCQDCIRKKQRQRIHNTKRISIIAAYRDQVKKIRKALLENKLDQFAEVDTIDAFQGKENDIVLISLVRTDKLGFVRNKKRSNVSLSRAKYCQYIFGNIRCLRKQLNIWVKVTNFLKKHNLVKPYREQEANTTDFFRNILLAESS